MFSTFLTFEGFSFLFGRIFSTSVFFKVHVLFRSSTSSELIGSKDSTWQLGTLCNSMDCLTVVDWASKLEAVVGLVVDSVVNAAVVVEVERLVVVEETGLKNKTTRWTTPAHKSCQDKWPGSSRRGGWGGALHVFRPVAKTFVRVKNKSGGTEKLMYFVAATLIKGRTVLWVWLRKTITGVTHHNTVHRDQETRTHKYWGPNLNHPG